MRSAAYLSRKADALDEQNGTGQHIRDAFANTVGLTGPETAALFSLVTRLDAQFAALDAQAAVITAKAKSQRTPNGLIPPPPPELRQACFDAGTVLSRLFTRC